MSALPKPVLDAFREAKTRAQDRAVAQQFEQLLQQERQENLTFYKQMIPEMKRTLNKKLGLEEEAAPPAVKHVEGKKLL